jgi:hypothetical protein
MIAGLHPVHLVLGWTLNSREAERRSCVMHPCNSSPITPGQQTRSQADGLAGERIRSGLMCIWFVCSSSRFNTVGFLQTFFAFSFLKVGILPIRRCAHEKEMPEIFVKSVSTTSQCPTSDILFHLQPAHCFSHSSMHRKKRMGIICGMLIACSQLLEMQLLNPTLNAQNLKNKLFNFK